MIRGVNLGNWLVLEKWMSPEPFAGTDAEDESNAERICLHDNMVDHRLLDRPWPSPR
jgi:hypothetical protein